MKKIIMAALFLFLVAGVYGVGYSEDGSGFATFGGTRMCMADGSVPLTGTWDFSNATVSGINLSVGQGIFYANSFSGLKNDLNNCASGGIVYLSPGVYYANESVVVPASCSLIGMGMNTTVIKVDTGAHLGVDTIILNNYSRVENLKVIGEGAPRSGRDGIVTNESYTTYGIIVRDVVVENPRRHGVNFEYTKYSSLNNAWISGAGAGCSGACAGMGVFAGGTGNNTYGYNTFSNIWVNTSYEHGVRIWTDFSSTYKDVYDNFDNIYAYENREAGLSIQYGGNSNFANIFAWGNGLQGFHFSANNNSITNAYVWNNTDGFRIIGQNNLLSNVHATGNDDNGFEVSGSFTIIGFSAKSNADKGISQENTDYAYIAGGFLEDNNYSLYQSGTISNTTVTGVYASNNPNTYRYVYGSWIHNIGLGSTRFVQQNLIYGTSSNPRNFTLYSSDGSDWNCGVNNSGIFNCA